MKTNFDLIPDSRGLARLSLEEITLVEGCRQGDENAWLALYRSYAADIGRYLNGMVQSNEVDDLVQKVFLEFLSSLERFRGESGLRTWLHCIARNVALHQIRGRDRRTRLVRSYAESFGANILNPEHRLAARDRLNLIKSLLSELDEIFREAWVLREIQEFSVAETAQILNTPEATVRTRHMRARQRLFDLIDGYDAETPEQPTGVSPLKGVTNSPGGSA